VVVSLHSASKVLGASVAAAALLAGPAAADVFVLVNGDRITGRQVAAGKRNLMVQTSYGRLNIPREKVDQIIRDDGKVEIINKTDEAASALPLPEKTRLILVVLGRSFWYAWDPKESPQQDPTLRMEVRLDEAAVATYVDAHADPNDIPKALVNTFSFSPEEIGREPGRGVLLPPPEARPGRIVLKIDVPDALAGSRQLRLAYQINIGSATAPSWKDVTVATAACELNPDSPTFLQVKQDPGRMEFSGLMRRRMKLTETFRIDVAAESGS
jgi:hypothetical protein